MGLFDKLFKRNKTKKVKEPQRMKTNKVKEFTGTIPKSKPKVKSSIASSTRSTVTGEQQMQSTTPPTSPTLLSQVFTIGCVSTLPATDSFLCILTVSRTDTRLQKSITQFVNPRPRPRAGNTTPGAIQSGDQRLLQNVRLCGISHSLSGALQDYGGQVTDRCNLVALRSKA